jgi:galactose mutarotase-like enzyme
MFKDLSENAHLPEIEGKSKFNIETIKSPEGNEISFSPERGGIIKSLKLKGTEVLFMDEETFEDSTKNVKGGIPIMFPNAGPLEGKANPYPNLKQHGFARTSDKWLIESKGDFELVERFTADEKTEKAFPYNFMIKMRAELENDGSITISQEATNLEEVKDLPVSMGLHPYLKVPNEKKKEIKFDFPGGERIEQDFSNWSEGGTISIDNPKLKDPEAVLRLEIPKLGTIVLDVSQEYRKIWVWSLPGKDFVCVEPTMRDEGGLIDDPELIKPHQTLSGKVNFRME